MTSPVTGPDPGGSRGFTMSALVARTGVPAATIRYYLIEGLLPPPVKVASNRFFYDERHVELVRLVRLLRERRGLSIERIAQVLPDLLPDLLGKPGGGIFRPEMWGEVLGSRRGAAPAPMRDRLVEIGVSEFSRDGYADVTVDDICRAADIAKGSFYRHFASKEELFLAVAETVAGRSADAFAAWAVGRAVSVEEAVGALSDALAAHLSVVLDLTSLAALRRPGYARALRSLTSRVSQAVRPMLGAADPGAADPVAADQLASDPTASGTASPGSMRDSAASDRADEVLARAVFEGVRRVVGRASEVLEPR